MSDSLHRLIVLSGPSCAGKSPLKKAIQRQYPQLLEGTHIPVLYNSRAPRPGEEDGKDYHFRPRQHLEELRSRDGFLVLAARNDLQAIDLEELSRLLKSGDVLYEGNVHVALRLMAEQGLPAHDTLDAFLSPVGLQEARDLMNDSSDLDAAVTNLMRQRLLRRLYSKKPHASLTDLEDIEVRATAAPHALRHAPEFTHVIVNHDGEDSDHWELLGRPLGDARRAVEAFATLLREGSQTGGAECPPGVEIWPRDVLGDPDCEVTDNANRG